MSVHSRFFVYLISLIVLSVSLGELLANFAYHPLHWFYVLVLASAFLVLFYFIRKDFLKPMLSIENWVSRYKHEQQQDQSGKNSLSMIHDVLDHLVDESEGLYDEMNDVLQAQIKRLSKKSSLLETLYAVSSSLNEISDLDALLTHFLQLLINMTRANCGVIRMLDDKNELNIASIIGNIDQQGQVISLSADECLCHKIAQDSDVRVQFSIQTCARCVGFASEQQCTYGTIFIPLQHQQKTLGIVSLFFDKTPSLSQDERSLLKTIGDHLAIAVDKAKTDVKAQRLSLVQERLFLSQDIHDSLSQILYSIGLQTSALLDIIQKDSKNSALNKAKDIQKGVEQANIELRELLNNFRKPPDGSSDLLSRTKNIASQFEKETQIAVYVHCVEVLKVPIEIEQQIIHIIQEALSNIKKHAKASNVRILLSKSSLMIGDDGCGFDIHHNKSHNGYHIGLNVLQERAARIGAKLSIESEPDEGTQIILNLSP